MEIGVKLSVVRNIEKNTQIDTHQSNSIRILKVSHTQDDKIVFKGEKRS